MELREVVFEALVSHFKSVIEKHAEMPFAETEVNLPKRSFEGYADAIVTALSQAPLMPVYGSREVEEK